MKFVMERAAAMRALTFAGRVAVRGAKTIPILGHALITASKGRVSFAVTDMDRHLVVEVGGAATGKTGSTTANVGNIAAFVRATPEGGQIEVELAAENLVLRAGRARATLPTLPPADFPALAHDEATAEVDVAGDVLARAIDRVIHAQSSEETRYYLNGIYLHASDGKLRLVATDGFRLGWADCTPSKPLPDNLPGIIVPRQAIGELQLLAAETKAGDVTLEISANRLRVAIADVECSTKLIDGTFPDYHRVIPRENDCRFSTTVRELDGAVARCAAIASDKGRAVKMVATKQGLQLSHRDASTGEVSDEIEAQLATAPAETGFNGSYMAASLAALGSKSVDVEFTPGGPILMRDPADRDGQLQLVMAMRV